MTADDQSSGRELAPAAELGIDVAVAGGGFLLSHFFGLPVDVAAATGGPVVSEGLKRLGRVLLGRADDVREGVIAGGVNLEKLLLKVETGGRTFDLWSRAVRAALDTDWKRKRVALGHALAEGTLGTDDFGPELALQIIRGIEAVEQHDIRVLAFMEQLPERDLQRSWSDKPVTFQPMHADVDELAPVLTDDVSRDVVIENLESAGLIDPVGLRMWNSPAIWAPTRLGLEVLRTIREAPEDQDHPDSTK